MNDLILPIEILLFLFFVYCLYAVAFGDSLKILSVVVLLSCAVFLTVFYYQNYVQSPHIGIVKTKSAEHIGYITKRPFTKSLIVKPTPLFPILNCPVSADNKPSCSQELLVIDKQEVVSIEIIDER